MYLLVASSEERQLELYVGLKEASKCQELVELERGRAGPREREREEPRGVPGYGHSMGGP